jgi:ribosomal protein S18 acetylase RimI-like enzyme
MKSDPAIRAARKADASEMVALIDCAGYGMPLWVWQGMKTDEASALEVGRKRAMRDEGSFSYRNAHILEDMGQVMGMLIGYPIDDPYDMGEMAKTPEAFRPLVELEAQAPGSWYVNVVAVHAEHRGKGLGSRLLGHAEYVARQTRNGTMSIIFESRNLKAYRLYERLGYREAARRPRVSFPGDATHSKEWILMKKLVS